jgi:aspartyl-tRNA(Asn)/glutamyl-tRNA(Gln) amidotransferase subunit A
VPSLGVDFREGLEDGIAGLRIGYSRTLGYARVDPEVAALVDQGARKLEALGAQVDDIDVALEDPIVIMQPLWSVALALAIAPLTREQRALMDQPLLTLAEAGLHLTALDYRRLERAREAFAQHMHRLHQTYDVLLTPQLAVTAFEAGHQVPPQGTFTHWWEWSPFSYAFNLTQQPAATVPCGFTAAGLPVALQLVGAKFADVLILRAARAYEAAHPFVMPTAEGHKDRAGGPRKRAEGRVTRAE